MRITLDGAEAENYIEWRKRNGELAKEILELRGEVAHLKSKLKKIVRPKIGLIINKDGDLLDVKEG
jgi:hypothetical protein